jgi:N-acetylglucosaminyldiphosphoundecaprenol N-acetyl-beta-D-mannosaminyltransferase
MDDAIARIDGYLAGSGHHHIVTADASMFVLSREDSDLAEIVRSADLVTPDGMGLLWAARLLKQPIASKVSGVDLVGRLCAESVSKGFRIYFFGASPGVAEDAKKRLCERFPGANVCGVRDGFFAAGDEEKVADEIAAAKPDVLLVALGIPKQEKFIRKYVARIGCRVAIGIGGSFDVYSGRVQRAPVWMQNAGLEWAFRLAQNPKKLSKVMTLPRFVMLALRTKFAGAK